METIEKIRNNEVYKQVLKESMGGVMYDVANYDKYESAEVLTLWKDMSESEKDAADGIMKGAINFLEGN